jgi:hypothetical protein
LAAESARLYISRATPPEENSIGVEIARTDGLVAFHPWDEAFYVIDGQVEVTIAGKATTVLPGGYVPQIMAIAESFGVPTKNDDAVMLVATPTRSWGLSAAETLREQARTLDLY